MNRGFVGRCWLLACAVMVAVGVMAAPAAASADTLTPTFDVTQINGTEGQPLINVEVGQFNDSAGDDTAGDYTAAINWGDGNFTGGTVSGTDNTTGPWTVQGSHAYGEEGSYLISVKVTDTATSPQVSTTWDVPVTVADAGLSLPAGAPTEISGAGGSAGSQMQSFEAAIGGADNGTTPGEQNGGYRHITWDDVALNGTDPGSSTITAGHVVSIAPNREQPWGISLSRGVAVANDGFTSVNNSVAGKFPAFSPPNVFAPFNSNRITMSIVAPAGRSSTSTPAATRGLGIMFLNVWQNNTTTIQYFSGTTLLYSASAPPASGPGQSSFVGVVFPSAAVTQVVITMGTATIFGFDGSTVTQGPADTPPTGPPNGNDLVAGDDVVLAEPTTAQTTLQGTAGVPVSGTLDSFSDTDSNNKASDYTAIVNWGDGSLSNGSISGSNGGFSVTGTHTYTKQGTFQVTTTTTDFGGATQTGHATIVVGPRSSATSVSCAPSSVTVKRGTICTATVSDVGSGSSITPMGLIAFSSHATGASFTNDGGCQLSGTAVPGKAQCSVVFVPTKVPAGPDQVAAAYQGDQAHSGSTGTGTVSVKALTCTIELPTNKLPKRFKRLHVFVSCQMHAAVDVTIVAVIHKGRRRTRLSFGHLKTTVDANKGKRLRILVSRSVLEKLVSAVKHKERVSLKLTIVATPTSNPVTVTTNIHRLKFS